MILTIFSFSITAIDVDLFVMIRHVTAAIRRMESNLRCPILSVGARLPTLPIQEGYFLDLKHLLMACLLLGGQLLLLFVNFTILPRQLLAIHISTGASPILLLHSP